jgi:hypothetical protein
MNVSNNLDIPFLQLKQSMVTNGLSLGQSIQKLRPTADAQVEVQRAETDATTFVQQNDTTVTTSKTTTSSTTKTKSKSKNKGKKTPNTVAGS